MQQEPVLGAEVPASSCLASCNDSARRREIVQQVPNERKFFVEEGGTFCSRKAPAALDFVEQHLPLARLSLETT